MRESNGEITREITRLERQRNGGVKRYNERERSSRNTERKKKLVTEKRLRILHSITLNNKVAMTQ